jgi:hypothetical protein
LAVPRHFILNISTWLGINFVYGRSDRFHYYVEVDPRSRLVGRSGEEHAAKKRVRIIKTTLSTIVVFFTLNTPSESLKGS